MGQHTRAKAHHKVPRFYIEGFRIDTTGSGKNARVWVYRMGEKSARKARPSATGFETDFNSRINADGTRDTSLEEWLANNVDTPAAKLWPKFSNHQHRITDEERMVIAVFAAFLFTRTANVRRMWGDALRELQEKSLRMKNAHEERPDLAEIRRFKPTVGEEMTISADELLNTGHNDMIDLVGTAVPEISQVLVQLNWTIFHTSEEDHFITSDNPVSRVNPSTANPFQQANLHLHGVEVALPVTKSCCLVMSYEGPEGRYLADSQAVKIINDRTLSWADSEVYSSRKEPWIAQTMFE